MQVVGIELTTLIVLAIWLDSTKAKKVEISVYLVGVINFFNFSIAQLRILTYKIDKHGSAENRSTRSQQRISSDTILVVGIELTTPWLETNASTIVI